MRKLVIASMLLLAFACSKPEGFVITGKIIGEKEVPVYLKKKQDGKWVVEDSTVLADEKFKLIGKTDLPELRTIQVGDRRNLIPFFAENGKITIKASSNSIENAEVAGSRSNELFTAFTDHIEELSKEIDKLRSKFNNARMTGNEENMQIARIDFDAMIENQNVFTKNYIRENNSSPVSAWVALWQLADHASYEELEKIIELLDPTIKESIYIKELEGKKGIALGATAPDFSMNDPEGNNISLSSLRGKVVLVDFWASWCGPCRVENPHIVEIYNKFKDKGFDIIGVSLDRDKDAWVKAIKDDKLDWHHVSDLQYWRNEAARLYNVSSIPYTVLLDKDGKIIAKKLHKEQLIVKLTEIFSSPI